MKASLLSLLLFFFRAPAFAEDGLAFVVNQANGVASLSASDLADYYFKRKLRWPNGTKVQFIDQKDGTPRKELFLKQLEKTQRELDLYWIGEKNFSGSSAPLQVPNDSMVLSMVGSLPGAIGYVSADKTELGKTRLVTVKKSE